MSVPPDDVLLCERCGYVLEGLPVEGKCPECGQAIDESLPERRTGTPWQGDRPWLKWLPTNWQTLRKPVRTFRTMKIQRGVDLLTINSFLGSTLGMLLCLIPFIVSDMIGKRAKGLTLGESLWAFLFLLLAAGAIGTAFFEVLSWIERLGIRFYGRKRGWRITRDVSHAITNHASVGWFIGATLTGLLYAVVTSLAIWAHVDFGMYGPLIVQYVPLSGVLVGLLTFEILVYIGVRQCKFANTPARIARAMPPA